DLASAVHRRIAEGDLAVDRVFDGAREKFAVGHVVVAVGGDERAPTDVEREISAGTLEPDLLLAVDPLGEAPRLLRLLLPGCDRIRAIAQAGAVVEVLVVGERHLRLGGVGVRWEEREAPAKLAGSAPFHHRL